MKIQSSKLQYLLLGAVVLGSVLFYLANTLSTVDAMIHHADRARVPFDFSGPMTPLPEALEAGIQPTDFILSIDGLPFNGMAGMIEHFFNARVGQPVMVTYRTPAGDTRTARFALSPLRSTPQRISFWVLTVVRVILFPAACLLLGYWVVLSKPNDWNAWFFLGVMNVVPVSFGLWGYYPGLLTTIAVFWQTIAVRGMFICLILLGIYFPVRSRLDLRYPWIKWLLIAPQILLIPCNILLNYGELYSIHRVEPYLWAAVPLRLVGYIFSALSLIFFLAAVIRKLFTVPDADALRRLGVVAAGSFLGLTPVLIFLLFSIFTGVPFNASLPVWLIVTLVLLFALFPLSLAYTVIVQRALDVRIFLRQGTRYAFARGTLWTLQAGVLAYLAYRLVHLTHDTGHRLVHLIAPIVFVLVVLVLRLRVAQPLSLWLDRRFFREAYSAEQVLSELSEQARGFTETEPLLHTLLDRICETLHVETVAVFLRQDERFCLQYFRGLPQKPDLCLPDSSPTVRALARSGAPLRLGTESAAPSTVSPEDSSILNQLHANLILPLPGRSSLMGLMALGPKRSEEPYSSSDRRLLQSVALQTGLAIENSELIRHLAEQESHRKRMDRELEIAQEVQARLFPQVLPVIEHVDLAGFCRTAQQIGGDYYDFIPLENGRLGIAIGDVSGKGISAALLMASIRAALRGLTLSGTPDPAQLMQRMNQIAFDSLTGNRFTTFFYGQYDPRTRHLDYVNAGHDAPILLRVAEESGVPACGPESRAQTQRLEIGGPVMGIFPEVEYQHGTLELRSCDVLVAYTDGLSETMTETQAEWGEERILAAASEAFHDSAQEIVRRLVAGADAFAAGAPQNDDLTLIVMKVE